MNLKVEYLGVLLDDHTFCLPVHLLILKVSVRALFVSPPEKKDTNNFPQILRPSNFSSSKDLEAV
jgi:hypothetical protein